MPSVKNNDIKTVVKLINRKIYFDDEPLHTEVSMGHLSIFVALLEGKGHFRYDYLNHLQATAVSSHRPEMLKIIIEKAPIPTNRANRLPLIGSHSY